MFFKCCDNRMKLYEQLVGLARDVIPLFEGFTKTFNDYVDEQKDICPGCRFWLKTRYAVKGGKK